LEYGLQKISYGDRMRQIVVQLANFGRLGCLLDTLYSGDVPVGHSACAKVEWYNSFTTPRCSSIHFSGSSGNAMVPVFLNERRCQLLNIMNIIAWPAITPPDMAKF